MVEESCAASDDWFAISLSWRLRSIAGTTKDRRRSHETAYLRQLLDERQDAEAGPNYVDLRERGEGDGGR